jgi:hypothetical protein
MTLLPFTLHEQISAVEREIGVRNKVYLRRVTAGTMRMSQAKREIALMEAVLETLNAVANRGILHGEQDATHRVDD